MEILKSLVLDAKELFFINNVASRELVSNKIEQITTGDIFLGIMDFLVRLIFELQYQFTVAAFAVSSLTIWIATNNFKGMVKPKMTIVVSQEEDKHQYLKITREKVSADKIQEGLNELIVLANAVNSAWKQVSFWVILEIAIWFSKDLDVVMKTSDYFWKAYLVILIGYLSAGLFLSAECARKVR